MLTTSILFFSMLAACGDKSAATPSPAAESGPKISMDVPEGGKAFVSALTGAVTKNFEPTDADGASFMYTELQFRADGTWAAQGYVEAMDERMECAESGTWSVEDVSSKTVATIAWTVSDTSCVGRDKGASTRAQVTAGASGISSALFR
jgi:hypothetical protein